VTLGKGGGTSGILGNSSHKNGDLGVVNKLVNQISNTNYTIHCKTKNDIPNIISNEVNINTPKSIIDINVHTVIHG